MFGYAGNAKKKRASSDSRRSARVFKMNKTINDEEICAAVQAQIIECLNRFYAIETGMWGGGPLDALIIRTTVVGEMQHKPYDLSALAIVLDLPLSTVHRKVMNLIKTGFLVQEKAGRSIYLHPTSRTRQKLDKSFEEMVSTLWRLYRDPTSMWKDFAKDQDERHQASSSLFQSTRNVGR